MKKLGLALSILLLGLAPARPQPVDWPPPAGTIAFLCVYNTTLPTYTNGQVGFVQCDNRGRPIVSGTVTVDTTGLATSAKQDTGNTTLASILAALGSPFQASGSISNTAFIATAPVGITPTDRTITSATGASQTVMAANASRHSLVIVNTGNANCGINPTGGTAAIGGAGTLTLTPTGSYAPRIPTLAAITAICNAGQPLYADEN